MEVIRAANTESNGIFFLKNKTRIISTYFNTYFVFLDLSLLDQMSQFLFLAERMSNYCTLTTKTTMIAIENCRNLVNRSPGLDLHFTATTPSLSPYIPVQS